MDVKEEIRVRIIAKAEQMFEQSGRDEFPTVDAVRKLSKTNMSDTSAVMRDWRRQQRAAAGATPAALPDRVKQLCDGVIRDIWTHAQRLASEEVQNVQREREEEKLEAEQLRVQMAAANEDQVLEIAALRERSAVAEATAITLAENGRHEKLEVERQRAVYAERARIAEARVEEIDKRADDFKAALDDAFASNKSLNSELDAARGGLAQAVSDLAMAKSRAEADQSTQVELARRLKGAEEQAASTGEAANAAREEAAHMRGQCELLRDPYSALLDRLKASKRVKPSTTAAKR